MTDTTRPNFWKFLLPLLLSSACFGALLGLAMPAYLPAFVVSYLLVALALFLCMANIADSSPSLSIRVTGLLCGIFLSGVALSILVILYWHIPTIDGYHPFILLLNAAGFLATFVFLPFSILVISLVYGLIFGPCFGHYFHKELERIHRVRQQKEVVIQIIQPQDKARAVMQAVRGAKPPVIR